MTVQSHCVNSRQTASLVLNKPIPSSANLTKCPIVSYPPSSQCALLRGMYSQVLSLLILHGSSQCWHVWTVPSYGPPAGIVVCPSLTCWRGFWLQHTSPPDPLESTPPCGCLQSCHFQDSLQFWRNRCMICRSSTENYTDCVWACVISTHSVTKHVQVLCFVLTLVHLSSV